MSSAGVGQRAWGSVLALALALVLGAAAPSPAGVGRPAVEYVYDAAGRLVGVSDATDQAAVYEYDAAGNLIGISRVSADQLPDAGLGGGGVPVVSGVSPRVVGPGERLRITGEGFTGDPVLDQVVLAGSWYATVESASPTELVVTAPQRVLAGPVSVATPAGTGHSEELVFVAPWEFDPEQPPGMARARWGEPVEVSLDGDAGLVGLVVFDGARGDLVGVDLLAGGDGEDGQWLGCEQVRTELVAPDMSTLRDRQSRSWADQCGGGTEGAVQLPADGSYALMVMAGRRGVAGMARVDVATGQLQVEHTDLVVEDVFPLPLTRSYQREMSRASGGEPVPGFGLRSGLDYRVRLRVSSTNHFADLMLPTGQQVEFRRISYGADPQDALLLPVGGEVGELAGSRVVANGEGWDLLLADGTAMWFAGHGGPLREVRDRNGNTLTVERDALWPQGSGNVFAVYSPSGRWLRFDYDDRDSKVVRAWDHTGRTVTYRYDEDELLVEALTYPAGGDDPVARVGYEYDEDQRVVSITDYDSEPVLTVGYDQDGRVVSQELADGSRWEFAYTIGQEVVEIDASDLGDEFDDVDTRTLVDVVVAVEVTDPAGQARRVEFDNGHWVGDAYGVGSEAELVVTLERDPQTGLVSRQVDPDGRQTSFGYDPAGNLTSITVTDPDSGETSTVGLGYQEPDPFDLASLVDPAGYQDRYTHDQAGNLTSVTGPDGATTTYAYDRAGRVVGITGPDGAVVGVAYELAHRVTVTDPQGYTVSEFYDAAGRLAAVTDPAGHTTRVDYDPLDRPVRVTDPAGGETTLTYDPVGNLTSLTDPAGNTTTYVHEPSGLVVERADPAGAVDRYTYDPAGRLTSQVDRRGVETTVDYDALDQPVQISFGDESTVRYEYDEAGRLVVVDDSAYGSIVLGYDHLDRVITETTEQGEVTYTYDPAGRRTSMTLPDGTQTSYTYDDGGELVGISQPDAAVAAARDPAGLVSHLELPNGVTAAYRHDQRGLATGITYRHGTGLLGNLTYTYDGNYRRVGTGGTLATIDLPPPLDDTAYEPGNRLTRHGDEELVYDRAGNLIDDGTHTYTWDARGHSSPSTDPRAPRSRTTRSGAGSPGPWMGSLPASPTTGGTSPSNTTPAAAPPI